MTLHEAAIQLLAAAEAAEEGGSDVYVLQPQEQQNGRSWQPFQGSQRCNDEVHVTLS